MLLAAVLAADVFLCPCSHIDTRALWLSDIPPHHLLRSYATEEAARVKEKLNSRDPIAPESEVIGLLGHC